MLETENKRVVVEGYDELMIFGGSTKLFDKDKIKKEHPEKHYAVEVQSVPRVKTSSHMAASGSGTSSRSHSSTESSMFPSPMQQQSDVLQGMSSATPPSPEDLKNGNSASFPSTWAAWSDQEAMLINYLSSGVDINSAASAAFATDADPMSFLWTDMHANSPADSQGSHTGTGSSPGDSQAQAAEGAQQLQRAPSTSSVSVPGVQDPNAFGVFPMSPSSFAPPPEMKAAFEAEFGNSAFHQAQQQQQPQLSLNQGTSGWEALLWGGNAFS